MSSMPCEGFIIFMGAVAWKLWSLLIYEQANNFHFHSFASVVSNVVWMVAGLCQLSSGVHSSISLFLSALRDCLGSCHGGCTAWKCAVFFLWHQSER